MTPGEFTTHLRSAYLKRDTGEIIRCFNEFKQTNDFVQLYRKLVKRGKIQPSDSKIETILTALLLEIEEDIQKNRRLVIDATFYDIAEHLKNKFSPGIGDIYIETQIPSDFIAEVRNTAEDGDSSKLTETLVNNYKRELVRLEKGRRVVVETLQQASNFPLHHATQLNGILDTLQQELRSNYKYLSVKPYFLSIETLAGEIDADRTQVATAQASNRQLIPFKSYQMTGLEPTAIQLVKLQISVNRLFQFLRKSELLPEERVNETWTNIIRLFKAPSKTTISPKEWKLLTDLLQQINRDILGITKKLVATFIDEYRCAEEQMRLRHIIIQNELAYTQEYLNRLAASNALQEQSDSDKVKVAMDKLFCLSETFPISQRQQESAARKPFIDIERSALGISTVISPNQLSDWIKIYSILFSNAEYLERFNQPVDYSTMRKLISNLTTFHLYDNIAQLKNIVERNLTKSDTEERISQFKRLNEALKQRLMGLMGSTKDRELSLREMIEELGFLQNKSIQFVIAETFKGFQYIVDAFQTSSTDYFVHDQDAMLKESRVLYNQICRQSLKIFVRDRSGDRLPIEATIEPKRRSWFARIFS